MTPQLGLSLPARPRRTKCLSGVGAHVQDGNCKDTVRVRDQAPVACGMCNQTPGISRDGLGVVPAEQGQYAVECACGWRSAWWNTRIEAIGDWNNIIGVGGRPKKQKLRRPCCK